MSTEPEKSHRSHTAPARAEHFVLEMADGRTPLAAGRAGAAPVQGPTLALIRPSVHAVGVEP